MNPQSHSKISKVKKMLSIIIPTKNEPYINELVADIHKKVSAEHEILVVDKSDNPPAIKGARLILQKSNGLGNAVLEGLSEAKRDVILMMDGDGSHDPEYIGSMLSYIKNYDIVIGSRYVKGGSSDDGLSRVVISRLLTFIVSSLLGLEIKDPLSGFAMYRRAVLESAMLNPKGFKLLMEVCYKYGKSNRARIKEVPIRFRPRAAGKSKVGFNLKGVKEAFRIITLAISLRSGR